MWLDEAFDNDPSEELAKNSEKLKETLSKAAPFIPGVETIDDLLTLLTGCGVTCQAGYEDEVGGFWRGVALLGLVVPISGKSVRLTAEYLDDIAIIGKHPLYLEVAEKFGIRPFNIPEGFWPDSDIAQWAANQKYLDRAIDKGKSFLVAVDASIDLVEESAMRRTWLGKELNYLYKRGYKLIDSLDDSGFKWMVPGDGD